MSEQQIADLRIDRGAAGPRKARRWRVALLGVAAAALVLVGWQRISGRADVEVAAVSTAYPFQGYTLLNASGYVVAQRVAAVATKATGRLEWLGVREGSVVKKGEVIARLESADVRASARQAAAAVEVARAELQDAHVALERARDLARQKFIAAASLDAAQARSDKAQASLAVAEASLGGAEVAVEETQIRAPFDGVVLAKYANVGDMVTPFSQAADSKGAVIRMADMSTLEVEADVSETSLAKVRVGQPCEIALDAYPDRRLRGEVSRLVPTVDRSKASVMTKVKIIDSDLGGGVILPEMSAKVAFLSQAVTPAQRQPRTVVPQAALAIRAGRPVLFVLGDGDLRLVAVKRGSNIGDLVEVDGVKPGEKVVLNPGDGLRDGEKAAVAAK
jgi:HlyD family secretion protein